MLDIFGFLCWETVAVLTQNSLQVKKEWEAKNIKTTAKQYHHPLFGKPFSEQTPLLPDHIIEGFRRSQKTQVPLMNFSGAHFRTETCLI